MIELTEPQIARVKMFNEKLEALKKECGVGLLPTVVMSPKGTQYLINIMPDEVLNPQIGLAQMKPTPGGAVPPLKIVT
jgi:hypothetical protein